MASKAKDFLIRGLHNLRPEHRGAVATVGSFDGIHLGHQAILGQLKERAVYYRASSVVMMFEPQPREYFAREQAPARLMRIREKVEALAVTGVDRVFCLQFNRALRSLSAQEFVERVLVGGLGIRCLVVGDDFHFGRDRSGDYEMLVRMGARHRFEVLETHSIQMGGERISSTRIRRELEQGRFAEAAKLLGRPFRITGRVVYGQRLGTQLGVPTANLNLHRYRAPLTGVFAVEVHLPDRRVRGVANVGVRPTVGDLVKPVLEVHLLDWQGDLYGRRIQVEFKHKLREELRFASIEELAAQIYDDIAAARRFFAATEESGQAAAL
ncbi:MAG: bifunctional riboflavin kinase/FAD synthetase [Pseudomonadales bacterium]|nr:bifunctional riboflavin kinase/FAD synthetase [Pseudomonadales bacterium]